jgi:hypothetical protein
MIQNADIEHGQHRVFPQREGPFSSEAPTADGDEPDNPTKGDGKKGESEMKRVIAPGISSPHYKHVAGIILVRGKESAE